jgi:hydroxypyruvate isomerase
VARALDRALPPGVPRPNGIAGIAPADGTPARLDAVQAANLRHAGARLAGHGIRVQSEPRNRRDTPGTQIATTHEPERVAALVAPGNLRLGYDVSHARIRQGELVPAIRRLLPRIPHRQMADTPGRHEPGTGEIASSFALRALAEAGQTGRVGCEDSPPETPGRGAGPACAASGRRARAPRMPPLPRGRPAG